MAGYVGNKAVVLMRGPYSKHAWISIRSKVNTKDVQAQVWYMVAERNADDEEEGEATEKSDWDSICIIIIILLISGGSCSNAKIQ